MIYHLVTLIRQKFTLKESFPIDSLQLKIAFAKILKQALVHINPDDISGKLVLLPYHNGYVSLPMLHGL